MDPSAHNTSWAKLRFKPVMSSCRCEIEATLGELKKLERDLSFKEQELKERERRLRCGSKSWQTVQHPVVLPQASLTPRPHSLRRLAELGSMSATPPAAASLAASKGHPSHLHLSSASYLFQLTKFQKFRRKAYPVSGSFPENCYSVQCVCMLELQKWNSVYFCTICSVFCTSGPQNLCLEASLFKSEPISNS